MKFESKHDEYIVTSCVACVYIKIPIRGIELATGLMNIVVQSSVACVELVVSVRDCLIYSNRGSVTDAVYDIILYKKK